MTISRTNLSDAHPGSTQVKAMHFAELRTAVGAVRMLAGLPAASFTDPTLVSVKIKAVHLTQLRAALDAARAVLMLPVLSYTSPLTTVRASHVRNCATARSEPQRGGACGPSRSTRMPPRRRRTDSTKVGWPA